MEMTPQEKSRVWWHGAVKSAIKGIPQGIILGAVSVVALFGIVGCMIAFGGPLIAGWGLTIAHGMGMFMLSQSGLATFTTATAHAAAVAAAAHATAGATTLAMAHAALPTFLSFGSIGFAPIVAFNAILGVVGNLMNGGKIAVGDYQQQVDHAKNEHRIAHLQERELALEQVVGQDLASRNVKLILSHGPRSSQSFADAEAARAQTEALASKAIH